MLDGDLEQQQQAAASAVGPQSLSAADKTSNSANSSTNSGSSNTDPRGDLESGGSVAGRGGRPGLVRLASSSGAMDMGDTLRGADSDQAVDSGR